MSWLHAANQEEALRAIRDLYDTVGLSNYGESVTQVDHALQSAALAEQEGAPPSLIVAALLHDIGHLAIEQSKLGRAAAGDRRHERVGAKALGRWFDAAVTEPIRLHVAAKRYLCKTSANYAAEISAASTRSLAVQGGSMNEVECVAFEAERFARDAVRLRVWDDRAKVIGGVTPPFDHFEPLLRSVVRGLGR